MWRWRSKKTYNVAELGRATGIGHDHGFAATLKEFIRGRATELATLQSDSLGNVLGDGLRNGGGSAKDRGGEEESGKSEELHFDCQAVDWRVDWMADLRCC